jgi:signal transduction histidine kinase/HAMP domain-containing protein
VNLYRRLSLSTRLTLLALVALIPLVALIVLQNLDERDSRKEAGISDASVLSQYAAVALDQFATDIDSFTAAAAIRLGLQDSISHTDSSSYLKSLAARYPNLTALFVTDPQGRVVASASDMDNTGFDVSQRPYILELQGGKETVWTGGFQGLQTGEVIGTFGRVIRSGQGDLLGYLIAAFRPSNLSASLPADLPGDANVILIDQQGQLVFSRLQPSGTQLGEKLIAIPAVQQALAGQIVRLDGERLIFDEGERYGALTPIPHMGWVAGYTRSSSVLDSSLLDGLLQDLGLLSLIMVVVIGAMLLMSRQMTRPLKRLAGAAREVSEGREVVFVLDRSTDPEVADLQRAFTTMTAAVQERESRLVEQAERLRHLEEAGAQISAGLDFEETVRAVANEGTRLMQAEYGAFLSNSLSAPTRGQLQTFSGVSYPAFDDLLNPRNSNLYVPVFEGSGPLRADDLTRDTRARGTDLVNSNGHVPTRSFLAVPVVSGQGDVLGGLFYGHSEPGVFSDRHEEVASRIAAWASIALDNARLYEQAKVIEEELRKANVAKDEFLGVISHELRTPVTTIYGGLRILHTHRELLEGDQAEELIDSMADEGVRLVRLIEDLLALTRVELGKEIERSPAIPNDLVRETLQAFARLRPGREVIASLGQRLPLIEVEPTYFRQILTNLLSNADKYSPEDQPVTVETAHSDGSVRIEVTDRGGGVAPEEVEKIFDTFFRSEKTSGTAPGQGLGLTVCRKLVEAQGGKIWARNNPNGGFSVGFSFPTMAPVEGEPAVGQSGG